jgi:hypothetical protein
MTSSTERAILAGGCFWHQMTVAMARRVVTGDGEGTWRCLGQAIEDADELIALAPEEQLALLNEHRDYLSSATCRDDVSHSLDVYSPRACTCLGCDTGKSSSAGSSCARCAFDVPKCYPS